jgi:cytochrome c oxidase subunit II
MNDKFVNILVLTSGFALVVVILFGLAARGLRYATHKKNKILNKVSELFVSIQPHLLLFSLPVFLICVISFTLYFSPHFLPSPLAYPATQIVPLFYVTTAITGLAFFLTQILLFYFAFKYRTKPNRKATFLKNFIKLEILWTVIPAFAFLFLFLWGQVLWSKIITEPEGDALEIEVMGQQFSWWVRYPGEDKKFGRADFAYVSNSNALGIDPTDPNSTDDFMPIQLHVVKNKTVKLRLRSKDVIHSFFIPYFRVKMDAVPGMITKLYFVPTTSTVEMRKKLNDPEFNYEVACAELCGRMHFAMKLILVVDEPAQFKQWLQEQSVRKSLHTEFNPY